MLKIPVRFLEIAKSKKLLGEVANIGSGKEITIKKSDKINYEN